MQLSVWQKAGLAVYLSAPNRTYKIALVIRLNSEV